MKVFDTDHASAISSRASRSTGRNLQLLTLRVLFNETQDLITANARTIPNVAPGAH